MGCVCTPPVRILPSIASGPTYELDKRFSWLNDIWDRYLKKRKWKIERILNQTPVYFLRRESLPGAKKNFAPQSTYFTWYLTVLLLDGCPETVAAEAALCCNVRENLPFRREKTCRERTTDPGFEPEPDRLQSRGLIIITTRLVKTWEMHQREPWTLQTDKRPKS